MGNHRPQLYKSTDHWISSYNNFNRECQEKHLTRGKRPDWSLPKAPHMSNKSCYDNEHEDKFGHYGDNPRKLLPSTANWLITRIEENITGTTKCTSHIPGYTGFIPMSNANHNATRQSKGEKLRSTFLKDNIIEN